MRQVDVGSRRGRSASVMDRAERASERRTRQCMRLLKIEGEDAEKDSEKELLGRRKVASVSVF